MLTTACTKAMDYIRKFCFMLTLLYGVSVYSAEFDDLESRIDRMLERLSKVESETPDSCRFKALNLPFLQKLRKNSPNYFACFITGRSNLTNNETTDSFDHLESRVDQMLERLNKIDSQTSFRLHRKMKPEFSVESEDKLPKLFVPPLPQSGPNFRE